MTFIDISFIVTLFFPQLFLPKYVVFQFYFYNLLVNITTDDHFNIFDQSQQPCNRIRLCKWYIEHQVNVFQSTTTPCKIC